MGSANDMVDGQLCGLLMGCIGVSSPSMAGVEEIRTVNWLERQYEHEYRYCTAEKL